MFRFCLIPFRGINFVFWFRFLVPFSHVLVQVLSFCIEIVERLRKTLSVRVSERLLSNCFANFRFIQYLRSFFVFSGTIKRKNDRTTETECKLFIDCYCMYCVTITSGYFGFNSIPSQVLYLPLQKYSLKETVSIADDVWEGTIQWVIPLKKGIPNG